MCALTNVRKGMLFVENIPPATVGFLPSAHGFTGQAVAVKLPDGRELTITVPPGAAREIQVAPWQRSPSESTRLTESASDISSDAIVIASASIQSYEALGRRYQELYSFLEN